MPRLARKRPSWLPVAALAQDFRFVLRSLAKSPGYTLAVVLTLALGIGAATAIFSVADRALFRPLPYPAADELFVVGRTTPRHAFIPHLLPVQLASYRENAKSFRSLAAFEHSWSNVVVGNAPAGGITAGISADYFDTLGTLPLLGRLFLPGEDQPGAGRVIVLSHRFWRDKLGAAPTAIGRVVLVGGESCEVVGVLPPDFRPPLGTAADLYRPLASAPNPAAPFAGKVVYVVGRLQPGATSAQAAAELAGIQVPVSGSAARQLAEQKPKLMPLTEWTHQQSPFAMHGALLAAVAFLYAIACTNATSLMLARVHGRRRELSVRLAIGCSRSQLLRSVLAENLALVLLGGAGGGLAAIWGLPALERLASSAAAADGAVWQLDWRALAFAAALSLVTSVLVSLAPGWQVLHANVSEGLKDTAQALGESRRLRRVRGGLVVVEAALAMALLIGAGLMVRSVVHLQHIDRGLDLTNKVSVWLKLPDGSYRSAEAQLELTRRLEEQLRTIRGVQTVAVTTGVPPFSGAISWPLAKPDGSAYQANVNPVSPGFLRTLGLVLVRGEWFDDARPSGERVVVINEAMARGFFGAEDPLGRSLVVMPGQQKQAPWRVVGVVADVRGRVHASPSPQLYYPYWQMPSTFAVTVVFGLGGPRDTAFDDAVRRAVFVVDPLIATLMITSLDEAANSQLAQERYVLRVMQVLSALALALATAGLFAVMAYAVAQRMGEFGVRLALGALPSDLSRLVLRRGLVLASIGVLIGCSTAWALTRFLQSLLYETSPLDPLVYAAVALLLLAAAALGCWLPARRAARADVARLLRAE
ncbi:ADOP family duplicated permease [Opitutus terrae]|uniref:ADOP family duplicated permease n=1 Tax=Opitutus terrae TaxID=107709 RepID=UPI001305459C|nr:ADOP family duplicated permease [Opitutus terrae]